MATFSDHLHQAFSCSQYDLCMENRKTDLHRRQLEQQHSRLFDDIRNRLGDHRKLMLKLEQLQNEMDGIDDDLIYLQGFWDCVTLLKMIKLL